ncbi:MAG TPA: hypothetical protein VM760_01840 [Sphingomicrobium sp.]|nr:hypothetical protein [Sphingomicrobium sp.]
MRTTQSTVSFRRAFTLNESVGELPAGTYEIEVEEEEICGIERTVYRRIATFLIVRSGARTRTLTIDPNELNAALVRDAESHRFIDAGRSISASQPFWNPTP